MTEQEFQAIRERLSKVETDEWRYVGSHTDEHGAVSEYIVAGDYANEGEPDLVIQVWGSEDDRAYAEFIAHVCEDVPRLLAEIERLREALEEINKHIETRLESVSDKLCKEIETYTDHPVAHKRKRSVRVQHALQTDKQSLRHIQAIVVRALDGDSA
ncbi:hypothetical protein GCM10025857_67860 [Alicyclobacillus contaminans]|nr:hypothetical protein GCM10025857_15300 [Alicyclobacillus contaminans]GMA52022.1 hypothetical protein GCM10025857_33790 [Alicyclobacillus contaminans]GMA55429.1 hypothetical protein GCM10025857_67860 [Alicyclobacillus contaminans]